MCMSIGHPKEFTFHGYWYPDSQSFELRIIGSLRPPDELIERGLSILQENAEGYEDLSDDKPVYIGKVTVGLIHVPGDDEENALREQSDDFEEIYRVESSESVVSGDLVGGSYGQSEPHQHKGWLSLTGSYYTPDDDKPDGWIRD